MSTEEVYSEYGYADDNVKTGPSYNFGLNAGVTFLKKFEWIPNGGKDGAEQEALDIVFTINGTDKSYRMFPVTKAYDKDQKEVTDPNSEEMKAERMDFNAKITHILHCFRDTDTIKQSFAKKISSFKEFCTIAKGILPQDFNTKPLDIFIHYGWQLKDGAKQTYLEIPKKMKTGKWLTPSTPNAVWKEMKVENPNDSLGQALYYINEKATEGQPSIHPFVRNGWFMNSNYAHIQKGTGGDEEAISAGAEAMNSGTASNSEANKPQASSW